MKQCSADLRELLQRAEQQLQPAQQPATSYVKPDLRVLAW
jgi:hypothetical protein